MTPSPLRALRSARRRVGARPALAAACVALGACDVPAPAGPDVRPGLVVFSILDPAAAEHVALLMQTRASVPDAPQRPVDTNDPVVSSGEAPVSRARVVLYAPSGDSAVAVEDLARRTDGRGAGVYRITPGGTPAAGGRFFPAVPGRTYRLRVTSSLGTAEGTTRVPSAASPTTAPTRNVHLARDTVAIPPGAVDAAGFVYSLRGASAAVTEGDAQYRRALERRLILPSGGDDWAFAYARERFVPGTRHTLTVTAADSNFFAYYGAQFDPFADRTQRTTLRGASGVFGSVLVIYSVAVTITGR
jgi:hypothetical protein